MGLKSDFNSTRMAADRWPPNGPVPVRKKNDGGKFFLDNIFLI